MPSQPMLRSYYLAERADGWRATAALANARTRLKWRAIEDTFVRLRMEPDDLPRDAIDFINQDCYQDSREGRACANRIRETAERDGVWGLIGEYRLDPEGEWEHGGSVWGLVGIDDNRHVEADIMAETLDALRAAAKGRCPHCHGTGRRAS